MSPNLLRDVVVVLAATTATANAENVPEVARALGLQAASIEKLDLPDDAPDSFVVSLESREGRRRLVLQRQSSRSMGARWVNVVEGHAVSVAPGAVRTYRGRIDGVSGASVSGALGPRGLHAMILGDGETWFVEPVPMHFAALGPRAHVVYGWKDVIEYGQCGTRAPLSPLFSSVPAPPTTGALLDAEIALDFDKNFYDAHIAAGKPANMIDDDMEAVTHMVSHIFEISSGVRFVQTAWITRSTSNGPYTSSGAGALLQQTASEWTPPNWGEIERDVVHLFTGKDLTDPSFNPPNLVIGKAYIGAICDPTSAAGIAESLYSQNLALRVALSAHEIGHNFGATHCDGTPDCFVMCPTIGGCAGGLGSFGPTAASQILAAKDEFGCLTQVTPDLRVCSATDMAGGVIGSSGPITLTQHGVLAPNETVSLMIAGGAPGLAGLLFLGATRIDQPFFGGTMVPAPTVPMPVTLDGSGSVTLEGSWLPFAPSFTEMYFQYWALDAGALQGVAGSNGMALTVPMVDPFDGAAIVSRWNPLLPCTDPVKASVTVVGGELEIFRRSSASCDGHGGVATSATFGRFDCAVTFVDEQADGWVYPLFGAFDPGLAPQGAGPAAQAVFNLGKSGNAFTMKWSQGGGTSSATSGNHALENGDVLRVRGVPGGVLEFMRNGVVLRTVDPWLPSSTEFVAAILHAPAGQGEVSRTWWDDFVLCPGPAP